MQFEHIEAVIFRDYCHAKELFTQQIQFDFYRFLCWLSFNIKWFFSFFLVKMFMSIFNQTFSLEKLKITLSLKNKKAKRIFQLIINQYIY